MRLRRKPQRGSGVRPTRRPHSPPLTHSTALHPSNPLGPPPRCQGGSGETYDWRALSAPAGAARGWLLAGGLHPGNVADAVAVARPSGVDVSSGVCGPDGLLKDAAKVRAFVAAARAAGGASGGGSGSGSGGGAAAGS
jgi:hypothetical protein